MPLHSEQFGSYNPDMPQMGGKIHMSAPIIKKNGKQQRKFKPTYYD
jgi:hypothetical protein